MPSNENPGLSNYADELMEATKAGKIEWKTVNPTTFVWETASPGARVSLQRVERVVPVTTLGPNGRPSITPRRDVFFLFQVFDLTRIPTNAPIVTADSSADAQLNQKFTALFDLIKSGISEKILEFLQSILPK